MLLGNMEVTSRSFQVAMPQQDLDGAQIGARLEQMSCKAVPQRMRRDLLGDSSAADGIVKDREDVVVADRVVRVFSGKEPLLGFVVSPVLPQDLEQNGRQHDHSILLSFAMDRNGHARRVDVVHSQVGRLGAPQARRVDGHQQGATFEVRRRVEYSCHFLLAEDQGKSLLLPWERNVLQQERALQSLGIKES